MKQAVEVVTVVLMLGLLVASSPAAEATWKDMDRPGGYTSVECGHEGMSVCTESCFKGQEHPDWCPKPLTDLGCLEGLTRIAVTASLNEDDVMPDICLHTPTANQECGAAGKPCCLQPRARKLGTLIRPWCAEGLTCVISDPVTSLPYGSTKHMEAVLRYPGSEGLLAAEVMGTCRSAPAVHEADMQPSEALDDGLAQGINSVLGQCGVGRLPCPQGTYCASNEDHLLGGERCVPMPECGAAYQPCCPPFSNGGPAVPSIVDKRAAVPTCNDPAAVCVWKSSLTGFDPSSDNKAVPLLTPPGSASMILQYPNTLCIPGLAECGQAGQPCCPHAQFATSNNPLYFRLHVCDLGLRCNETISLFGGKRGDRPILGVCKGAQDACGQLGQPCCAYVDQAGWEWRTCHDGQPGVFCSGNNTCTHCSSMVEEAGLSQSSLASLSRQGISDSC